VTAQPDWTTPGAYHVAEGVHRIPLPLPQDGLRAVNVYAIETDDGLMVVDAGWALERSRMRLEQALSGLSYTLRAVSRFLVTHVHRDHYTQAVAIRRELGTRISLGAGEEPTLRALAGRDRGRFAPQLCQLRRAGAQPVIDAISSGIGRATSSVDPQDWEPPDDWLDGGVTIAGGGRELVAVSTPGHTRGHLVFVDRDNGLLFAGDHVLPHITPSIGFEAAPGEQPLRAYLASLRLVRQMPDLRLLPAHGSVTDSAHARVDELLAHHDERLRACLAAVRAGAGTAYETARALRWTRRQRGFDDLDPFNQMLAVTETLAHVDLLAAQGSLVSDDVDGVRTYDVTAA
jgi:glyoxylase-like metal-dependent hydrolase (beta-lactamase superfamily II)